MTSPGNPPIVPPRGYTASTIYQLQNVDPDALGRAQNADMHGELEGVRGNVRDGLLGGFGSVPAALAPIINGIVNGWFGGGGVGDPLQVQYTVEAIKDAVVNGYTVVTVTSSGTRAIPDTIVEAFHITVGGGETGANGVNSTDTPSPAQPIGGRGGGYLSGPLDVELIKGQTLTCTVAPTGGQSRIALGATVLASMRPGQQGGIAAGIFGYTESTSRPGGGGRGGIGRYVGGDNPPGSSGTPGESSATTSGGTAGAYSNNSHGGNGGAGGNADPAAQVKSAGAGGGGGGGGGMDNAQVPKNGGAGGPGGYPGGGGGAGGGSGRNGFGARGDNGAGGIGAVGIIWLIYK